MVQRWTPPERTVHFADRSSMARAPGADAPARRASRSVGEAIDDYRTLALPGRDPGECFAEMCFERWRSRWGRRPVHAVTSIDLALYFHELALKDFTRAELDRERWYLAFFFAWLRHNRMSFSSPLDRRAPLPAAPRQRVVIWTADEQHSLLAACRRGAPRALGADVGAGAGAGAGAGGTDARTAERPPPYLRPLVLLALQTGLRLGNLLYLEWRHVDLLTDTIRIPAAEVRTGMPIEFRIPRESSRLLHALWQATAGLPGHRSSRVLECFGLPAAGGAPDIRSVHADFREARRRAEIRPGDLESLRWTFASNAARAGVPFRRTATVIDWSDMGRLITLYQRFGRPAGQRGPASRAPARFNTSRGPRPAPTCRDPRKNLARP